MPRLNDTIAALATPVGTAAIAVVRVTGADSARLVAEIFRETPPPRVARHGDYLDRAGALVDEVLFTYFQGPQSYTGEDSLEISCHGNPFIAQKILEDLHARGCRPAEAGEFTQRAFLHGRMDLSQAEAVMDLIHARSERALAAANHQLRGALGRQMSALVNGLLDVLARIEAYIDFPEEDLPAEDRDAVARDLARISTEAERLLATSHYGELLRDGIKTVLVGAPNVGKSSLLNRLVGRDRALVSPEPGTTRDFIEERVIVGPHWLRVIDTAGLSLSPTPIEERGMEKTFECVAEADLLIIVVDPTVPRWTIPDRLAKSVRKDSTILAINKMDIFVANEATMESLVGELPLVKVSALTGGGIDELEAAIIGIADRFRGELGEDGIAISARHASSLTQARECLRQAQDKLCGRYVAELLASDIRGALAAFSEITGSVDNEEMLDRLFACFCIGK